MDNLPTRILIADDDSNILFAFQQTFKGVSEVVTAENGKQAVEILLHENVSIAFVDITMPELDGLSVLQRINEQHCTTPIVIMTGYGTMSTAIDAMKLGAYDYITKPLDVDQVRRVAARALEVVKLRREVTKLKSALKNQDSKEKIVGSHRLMQDVFKKIGKVVQTPNATNILITGESGTGKELVARAVHEAGVHADEPFVAINCSAIPENLLETELFGHEKGAFTDAGAAKDGKFKVVGSGTIFLDEIGDMPVNLQGKILRAIESREFTPIGGHRLIHIDGRFIAATNRSLEELVQAGAFRKDLYYRLNVYTIELPPLRLRKNDIPELATFFIAKHSHLLNKHIDAISEDALQALMQYHYPGNVRELQNIIISALTQEQSEILTTDSIVNYLGIGRDSPAQDQARFDGKSLRDARTEAVAGFEDTYLKYVLDQTGGNVTRAAEQAGISRQSFQRMMRQRGIRSKDFRN